MEPHHQLLASFLKSCASLSVSGIKWGKALHSSILKTGHRSCPSVSKRLLNTYAKCGAPHAFHKLFGQILDSQQDPVLWNILLSGFSGPGSRIQDAHSLKLFKSMHTANEPKPSSVTCAVILPMCARLGDVSAGRGLHCYAINSGLETHTLVGNALLSMYAKCGLVCNVAWTAFNVIHDKDVSWNAMIVGFAENNLMDGAFKPFRLMLKGQIKPNHATIANILPVCASLDQRITHFFGKEMPCYVLRQNELLAHVYVWNALVSFYLRVGRVEEVELIFRRMESRDLVSWNAIIAGYASNDRCSKALVLFHELLSLEMIEPAYFTVVSILPVCAQLRNLQVGRKIHGYVLHRPWLFHDTSVGNAFISFYAKCDGIEAAYRTFFMMPSVAAPKGETRMKL